VTEAGRTLRAAELQATLHQRGLRMTPQRQMVLDAVRVLSHATPEAVCVQVQRGAPAVNISTVYRTLDLLETIGMVRHTHLGHGAPTYSADAHDHVHLVCHRCDRVTEIDTALLHSLSTALRRAHGFTLDPAHLALSGLCAACAAQPEEPAPREDPA